MRTVIVVGAGHAGLEAAFAAARVGAAVHVVTGRLDTIGQTPCNPSVGGVAKGHLVKEIDALGGFMGRAADTTMIHGRILNRSKGPAVQATRVQVDKDAYGRYSRAVLTSHSGIQLTEGLVAELCVERGRCAGVRLTDGSQLQADAVVVTTGTFLGGVLHTGSQQTPGGRAGEPPATGLSKQLAALGFRLSRLKTGTPPRLSAASIDFSRCEPQPGDEPTPRFTLPDDPQGQPDLLPQRHCHLTWTNPGTHALIERHLGESAMYGGAVTGRGPRYCPSVEDKVVRFAGRERHQVFLEPEGLDSDSIYPNGISTSLPAAVQEAFVRTIAGLEQAQLLRPGYAVEYDAVDARALDHRLGSKDIQGLFFAGQINGTSGYEEAGAQGLVAGANAALMLAGHEPLRIGRDEGYTGVMIDDLVTQGCDEPYRMFTSRAEFRIVLREDNADERLTELAAAAGLLSATQVAAARARLESVERLEREDDVSAPEWLRARARSRAVYRGYLERQRREIDRVRGEGASDLPLPKDVDYFALAGLTREAAERLSEVRPTSTAQAARIAGMTPAAVMCVWVHARALQRASSERVAPAPRT